MPVPPEDVEPSGSLKVMRWVELLGKDFACVMSESRLSIPCIWGTNVRLDTNVELPG